MKTIFLSIILALSCASVFTSDPYKLSGNEPREEEFNQAYHQIFNNLIREQQQKQSQQQQINSSNMKPTQDTEASSINENCKQ